MKELCLLLICVAILFSPSQSLDCSQGNPCDIGGFYSEANGYRCLQVDNANVACTCPTSGVELNMPCRPCNRSNPVNNVCNKNNPKLKMCLETNDFGTSYACLCTDPVFGEAFTTNADCDTTVTLTPSPTTASTVVSSTLASNCLNGGVQINGICNCPSGYSGIICAQKIDNDLCLRIVCKNNGVCIIRNPNGPYESMCACRTGTWGDYCELNGTSGFCSGSLCLNGGICKENVVGNTRHAYCQCQPGYNGVNCNNRYFTCPTAGLFVDIEMFNQGKYFECTNENAVLRAVHKSCPKGLRFNANVQKCTY